ncbi:hypothetical protein NC653_016276 [Populus alba x Populus x berolinensis]|uniref:Uncharacterized protein n=1 Tax=Populus alba x Populus x berolinensis TaxID=444605 RepID=A0AAD6VZH1_9ROSI|nr:hypothetical protein NC653_016276 [Populus alba x Populus x berolinensis]
MSICIENTSKFFQGVNIPNCKEDHVRTTRISELKVTEGLVLYPPPSRGVGLRLETTMEGIGNSLWNKMPVMSSANLAGYYHHCPWAMALGHPVITLQL